MLSSRFTAEIRRDDAFPLRVPLFESPEMWWGKWLFRLVGDVLIGWLCGGVCGKGEGGGLDGWWSLWSFVLGIPSVLCYRDGGGSSADRRRGARCATASGRALAGLVVEGGREVG